MDIENPNSIMMKEFFEKRPTKDVYEKCLLELLTEKLTIVSNEEYDKNLIEQLDKVIESIYLYLTVASK